MEKALVQSAENMGNRLERMMLQQMNVEDTQKGISYSLKKILFKDNEERKKINNFNNVSLFKKELTHSIRNYLCNESIWMSYQYNDALLRNTAKKYGLEKYIPNSISIWVSCENFTIRIGDEIIKN